MCHMRIGLHGMNSIFVLHVAESNTFLIIFRGGLSLPLYKEAPRLTEGSLSTQLLKYMNKTLQPS